MTIKTFKAEDLEGCEEYGLYELALPITCYGQTRLGLGYSNYVSVGKKELRFSNLKDARLAYKKLVALWEAE